MYTICTGYCIEPYTQFRIENKFYKTPQKKKFEMHILEKTLVNAPGFPCVSYVAIRMYVMSRVPGRSKLVQSDGSAWVRY